MRVWDINPGYLNHASLLGEHREVHAIFSIVLNGKKGYSAHPETLRWESCLGALLIRHELLVSEMMLRGFSHRSPAPVLPVSPWPERYLDPPAGQYAILKRKYAGKQKGRIPLPANVQQLWAQHKYSVLARDPVLYKRIGAETAAGSSPDYFTGLAELLEKTLCNIPGPGTLRNALEHMWGYVSSPGEEKSFDRADPGQLIGEIRKRAGERKVLYLLESTALSDLDVYIRMGEKREQ
jgi:hypothetical protein